MFSSCFCGSKNKNLKRISTASTKFSEDEQKTQKYKNYDSKEINKYNKDNENNDNNKYNVKNNNKLQLKKSQFFNGKRIYQELPLNVQERQKVPNKLEKLIQQYYKFLIDQVDGQITYQKNSRGQQEIKPLQMYRIQEINNEIDQQGNQRLNIQFEKVNNKRVARLIAENACIGNQDSCNQIGQRKIIY